MGEILLKLNVEHVEEIFKDCLLPDDYKNDTKVILVRTVTGTYGFDPKKLDKHSNDIKEMISQLSSNFDECHQGYTFKVLENSSRRCSVRISCRKTSGYD